MARYKKEDIDEARKYGDLRQLREAVAQIYGDDVVLSRLRSANAAAFLTPRWMRLSAIIISSVSCCTTHTWNLTKSDCAGWYADAIRLIAEFHDVEPDSLHNQLKR